MRYLLQRSMASALTLTAGLLSAPMAQAYIGPGVGFSSEVPLLLRVGWWLCLGLGILALVLWPIAILARTLIRP